MAKHEVYARFEYVCSNGHSIGAERPVTRCPLAWCQSTLLQRIGHGSRSNQEVRA